MCVFIYVCVRIGTCSIMNRTIEMRLTHVRRDRSHR